jgi:hypothetical protein
MAMNQNPIPYFQTGNPETEESLTLFAPGLLGSYAEYNQGTPTAPNVCRYQLVKCDAGITPAIGNVMYWVSRAAFTVTTVRTNRGNVAGIARIAGTIAASYIWILKRGDRTVKFQGAPTVAPDATGLTVVPSSGTDGVADSVAIATAPPGPVIGTTLAAAAASLALCRVNVPDQA